MTKYRKKPIIIEAEKFDGWPADNSQWVRDAISRTTEPRDNGSVAAVFIQTLEGEMRADRGDWIIRCVKGECYPCKPDIFEATYDPRPMTPDPIRAALARQALASLEGDAVERVALRRTVLDILNSVAPAVENLACNQEQADADGCMVKVSRQAVDEVLAAVNEVAIQAATATGLVAGEAAIRAAEREKCEHRVEELDCLYINDERCPFGGIPADPETSIRREAIKECLAAIRSGGGE